ncbi:MAG: NAD-dependent epimerase/dehydratase family protein [Bacteriovoracaceae bacterium]
MKNVLVTGAAGYLGSLLIDKLSKEKDLLGIQQIIAADVREPRKSYSNVLFEKLDVRDERALDIFKQYAIDCVVHLASIVTPGKNSNREFEFSVDVLGTKNILKACVGAKVKRIIISSSGAAYGYYPENINILKENDPIRGNYEFAYSYHKRLVEEECEHYRSKHPELEQTIFRITAILGEQVNNQITDLFKKPVQIGFLGSQSGFNFIWDMDAVECFKQSIQSPKTGIYNLAGDGVVNIKERAKILKKPMLLVPEVVVAKSLFVLKKLGLTQYGPEQTLFLKYRPLLDNTLLKKDFGFKPTKSSKEVLEFFAKTL